MLLHYLVWRASTHPGAPEQAITRLTKLLYLLDVLSQASSSRQASSVTWYFHRHGPWSREVRDSLERLAASGAVRTYPAGDTTAYAAVSPPDLLDADPHLLQLADRVVDEWAAAGLEDLLDYVYNRTGPMHGASRGGRLDMTRTHPSDRVTAVPPPLDTGFGWTREEVTAWLRQVGKSVPRGPDRDPDSPSDRARLNAYAEALIDEQGVRPLLSSNVRIHVTPGAFDRDEET